jgi:hypothetical protein
VNGPIQGQIDLQYSIGGLLLSQTFYVIPVLRQSMILGTDFLQKNESCLDWQINTLSLRQNTVNVNTIHISQGFATSIMSLWSILSIEAVT